MEVVREEKEELERERVPPCGKVGERDGEKRWRSLIKIFWDH